MSQNEIKLSTLRCEPYFADIPNSDEGYYGPPDLILWRIFVDDKCIAEDATPFLATDAVIELEANKCVPIFSDGDKYVSVRLDADKILWFGFHHTFLSTFDGSTLPTDVIYGFALTQYHEAVNQAQVSLVQNKVVKQSEPKPLQKFLNVLRGTASIEQPKTQPVKKEIKPLPTLTSQNLKDVLLRLLPYDFSLPLYRMPELDDDRRGERLYRAVWDAISLQDIQISEPPPNPIELRIGLDKDVFVEAVWQVGKLGDDVAILFVSEPHFPLWISGFRPILPLVSELSE